MADYVVVPKSSMDATADAIREKTGSQEDIEWTQDGFADAIGEIEGAASGSGFTVDEIAMNTGPSGAIVLSTATQVKTCAFRSKGYITSISGNLVTTIGSEAFRGCGSITTASFPGLTGVLDSWGFASCSNLTTIDLGGCSNIKGSVFEYCNKLETIIIRNTSICSLSNVNAFTNTPFKEGGTGGNIYIPKTLYDALGTGTNDYKATTNWSTVDAYGTITWACIEGSYYETHYADGTAIGGGS